MDIGPAFLTGSSILTFTFVCSYSGYCVWVGRKWNESFALPIVAAIWIGGMFGAGFRAFLFGA